jgi:hypothetical protein
MLRSTDKKFIFIHIPKTAGSALHNALLPYSHVPRRTLLRSLLRRLPIVEDVARAHFRVHDTADKIQTKLSPKIWNQYFSFAVVRNPFDHAISHYEYMKQYRNKYIADIFSRYSFEQYLYYRLSRRSIVDEIFAKMPNQSYFVTKNGKLIVSKILKYENLSTEISSLAKDLGGIEINMTITNPTKSRTFEKKIEYYKEQNLVDLVCELYSDDFDAFSYPKYPIFG